MTHTYTNGHTSEEPKVRDLPLNLLPQPGRKLADQDLVLRPRDKHGNRLTSVKAWDVPHIRVPMEHSKFDQLAQKFEPLTKDYLAYRYDLLHGAYENFRLVRQQVDEAWQRERERAEQVNRALDQKEQQLAAEAAAALEEVNRQQQQWSEQMEMAHQQAAVRVAAAGGCYDPARPEAELVLGASSVTRAQVLDQHQLPDPGGENEARLSPWLTYPASALVGSFIGISLGLLMGALNPATLGRKWTTTVMFCVVGLAPALFMRSALKLAFHAVGENSYLQRNPWTRMLGLATAVAVGLAFAVIDCMVEFHGLLKLARLDAGLAALSGAAAQSHNDLAFFCVAAIVTLGYLVYSAYEGWYLGRSRVIENRAKRGVSEADQAHRQARQGSPEVLQALEALSVVRRLLGQGREFEQRRQQLQLQTQKRQSELAAQRPTLSEMPSAPLCQQLQDAHDNLLGAQMQFDQLVDQLCGLRLSWWERLLRALTGRKFAWGQSTP